MSFDVFIIASSDSPPEQLMDQAVEAALKTCCVTDEHGCLCAADGFPFEVFGTMFALRGWSDAMGDVLFAVAERTSSFVYPIAENSTALRTPSNEGSPPDGLDEITNVKDAAELSRAVAPGFYGWASYRDYVRKQTNNED